MESLALLVSAGSFILGVIVLIVFFVMSSHIGSIKDHTRNTDARLAGIQSSLDKLIKILESKAS